jgi:hypothetical protein
VIDTAVTWVRAEAALRARRFGEAIVHLRRLVQVVDRIDFEYEEWLRALAEALRATGEIRQAIACSAYLGNVEVPSRAEYEAMQAEFDSGDEARRAAAIRQARLVATYLSRAGFHDAAAEWFGLGLAPLQRAIELERAGRDAEAIAAWERLSSSERLRSRPYEQALVRVNLALCLHRLRDERARTAMIDATAAVEAVADEFETAGTRERAFDCHQLIARIGVETGVFEHVAEGYLDSIRVLRDDGLKLDALKLYETFVLLARRSRELHAAATVLREASDFCSKAGLPYAIDLRLRAGDVWMEAGSVAREAGLPVTIAENAWVTAAECFASVGAFRRVAAAYDKLAALDGIGRRRDRYLRLRHRIGTQPDAIPTHGTVPDFLRQVPEYEEVWYVDLAEWEIDGDAELVAAGVMADRRFPDYVRRHALLLVLESDRLGDGLELAERVRRLQSIRAYPVLSALERVWGSADAGVRRDVAKALGSLRFKRSFALLERALRDEAPDVRAEAAEAVSNLFFPHAFDRLRRIFELRDLPEGERVRAAAMRAIGRVNSVEALDFLCDRLRDGDPPWSDMARAAISELSSPELAPYLRQRVDFVPVQHRAVLLEVAARLAARQR